MREPKQEQICPPPALRPSLRRSERSTSPSGREIGRCPPPTLSGLAQERSHTPNVHGEKNDRTWR